MFNLIEGPIADMCALLQYTPLTPDGLFASTDFCKNMAINQNSKPHM